MDKRIDNNENQGYIKIVKEQYKINCVQFKDVESVFQYIMNSLKFKVTASMISESLFSTYIKVFENYKINNNNTFSNNIYNKCFKI